MITLYGYYPSGNSYKIELLLTQLGIPFRFVHLDLIAGATRTPQFLRINPNGRIPVVDVEGRHLAESHAILWYFGEDTPLMPADRWDRAQVVHWLAFEQYHVEPHIGSARFHLSLLGKDLADCPADIGHRQAEATKALSIMDEHLKDKDFFVGQGYSLADISLFAYSHVAEEAGVALAPFPQLRAWQERVRQQPRFLAMTRPDRA